MAISLSRCRIRLVGAGLAAVLAAGVIVVVAYRVFAPADVLTPARPASYPAVPGDGTGVRGTLPTTPLIVAGRIRVSAAPREVSADGPVDAKYRNTPYWAYRRWPAELTGVIATNPTGGSGPADGDPLVVTRWTDGVLVALNARTGQIAWRVTGPATDARYDGRRTGARTVYDPPGLRLAQPPGGPDVLTVAGRTELVGLDPATGRQRWHAAVPAACRQGELTTAVGQLVAVDTCDTPRAVEFRDSATGAVSRRWHPNGGGDRLDLTGLGCAAGASGCPAIRVTDGGGGHGLLVDRAEPVSAPALDTAGTTVIGGLVIGIRGAELVARRAAGGKERWRHTVEPGSVILAVQPDRVHLLTTDRELLTLNASSGREVSRFDLRYGEDGVGWDPGVAYAADGFVAVERLTRPVDPSADDQRYYLAARPVILAQSAH